MSGGMGKGWARRAWARWAWPIVTFFVIGAFMIIAVVLRGAAAQSDAATPNTFLAPLEPAQHVNTREWRAIAAAPGENADARVVVWGQVTGFDPAADPSTFTANVDSARHSPANGTVNYPTPVILHGVPGDLRKLANGYIFTAEATVDAPAATGADASRGASRPSAGGGSGLPELTVTKLTITDKTVG